MAAIKISFALMLLRIEQTRILRRFLWAMIGVQVALGVYNTLATLLQCVPIHKAWDLVGNVAGTCWSRRAVASSSIAVSVINITTDFIFALLPVSFLRKIQRPVRERVIVGLLMGLGFFAGIASILKIVAAAQFGRTGDPINESVTIGMWSVIEELVGFIVICVPCLRSLFQRTLEACGMVSVRIKQHTLTRGYGRTYDSTKESKLERSQSQSRLATVVDGDAESSFKMKELRTRESGDVALWRDEVDVSNGGIWCTKEVVVENDRLSRMPSYELPVGGPNAGWIDDSFDLVDDGGAGRAI